ncbi:MAG: hypothetical protein ABEK12_03460, partial [Candidatus Nanohaloarchaea archaeon]
VDMKRQQVRGYMHYGLAGLVTAAASSTVIRPVLAVISVRAAGVAAVYGWRRYADRDVPASWEDEAVAMVVGTTLSVAAVVASVL